MGSPIDPGVARRLAEVFERRPEVTPFERDLLNSVKERFAKFGGRTHLSDKQAMVIDSVFVRTSADFESTESDDDNPEDAYIEDDIPF